MFNGEKTLVFWIGLLVFGYSLAQFCGAVWQTIYWLEIYPSVLSSTSSLFSTHLLEVEAVESAVPLIISGVIFAVIGVYMMQKGVKQEQIPIQT